MAYPAEEIDRWFESLEGFFEGKLSDDHALIRTFGGQGWRVRTMGINLVVLADRDFPYSKPQAFLESYNRSCPRPHIEPLAKLGKMARVCLNTPTVPHDPLLAVRSAVNDARELLKANENGEEDSDFENDFGAYWRHYLPDKKRTAEVLGLSEVTPGTGVYFYTQETYSCFPSRATLRRWSEHRWGNFVCESRRFPVLQLRRLPRPDRFPHDTETLIEALRRYTWEGLQTVGGLLRACPARLPIVFSGESSSGRTFTVAFELVVKTDDKGRRPVKARIQSKLPDEDVVRLYDGFPLDIRSLVAAQTRLPDDVLAVKQKKVVIVGCGALGSGIAMMLAKSGISHLTLVDFEALGWENIRRHELGSEWVGLPKTSALKIRIERSIPDIEQVLAFSDTIQTVLTSNPSLLADADLVISATGDWGSDVFLNDTIRKQELALPVSVVRTFGAKCGVD